MSVFCLASVNVDHFHRVDHLPRPGETVAASAYGRGLGGKGANQAVAAARAGARVVLIGAVGPDGGWARDRLAALGVDVRHLAEVDAPTGHAMICIEPGGENSIVIHGGANRAQHEPGLTRAMAECGPGDWLMLTNETSHVAQAAAMARGRGARVIYTAAPFEAGAARAMLPLLDLLIVNEGEAAALSDSLGVTPEALPVPACLVTLGARGARWHDSGGRTITMPAPRVAVVDSTGAGDTHAGYLAAALDRGAPVEEALQLAARAAALMVTRPGTADAIPVLDEVTAFAATIAPTEPAP
ncbi:MAG: ribokinase [Rhodobacteraceae bacterium]|nr:ribokinase [Paracoccaceae bacterium]